MDSCPWPSEHIDFVHVGVGEIAIARFPQVLVTSALGSCVGVALWDPFTLNGGLAHVMLPREAESGKGGPATRFADEGLRCLADLMSDAGSPSRRLIAKIAGGASMFRSDAAATSVGERNIEAVRQELARLKISLRAEDVGGTHARTVELHLDSGTLVVRSYAFGTKDL